MDQTQASNIRPPAVSGADAPRSGISAGGVFPFIAGNALLGTIGIFVHRAGVDALTTTWFRCAFGLLGLTLWMLLRGRLRSFRLTRCQWLYALSAGALMVIAWGLFFFAIPRISTGMAVLLFHVQPLWVFLLIFLCGGERPARGCLLAAFVAMVGLLLATGILEDLVALQGGAVVEFHAGRWLGVLACLLGALCTAGVTVLSRRLREVPSEMMAWCQCAVGTLALCMWPAFHGWPAWGGSLLWLAGLGLIHTGVAYTLIFAGMVRLETGRIVILQFVYPAVAILIDWQVFNLHLGTIQIGGLLLMGCAIRHAETVARKSTAQPLVGRRREQWSEAELHRS